MLNFSKFSDLRRVFENTVTKEDLIVALFEDVPELETFTFSVTNEYDDSNYSDYSRLKKINGLRIDYDNNYEGDEGFGDDGEEDMSNGGLPPVGEKISDIRVISAIREIVDRVGASFGYDDSHVVTRDSFRPRRLSKSDKAEREYAISYLTGKELDDAFFLKNDPKWALYYADDHGRFDEEAEFKIFAKKGRMQEAYEYARRVIKGALPDAVENFFILSTSSKHEDHEYLKKYLEFKNSRPKKAAARR